MLYGIAISDGITILLTSIQLLASLTYEYSCEVKGDITRPCRCVGGASDEEQLPVSGKAPHTHTTTGGGHQEVAHPSERRERSRNSLVY